MSAVAGGGGLWLGAETPYGQYRERAACPVAEDELPVVVRSILSVPGHMAEMVARAFGRGADQVAFDLEDSVPEQCKEEARRMVARYVTRRDAVRVNGRGTRWFEADIAAVKGLAGMLNLPKVESAADIAALRELAPGIKVLAVIESPLGVRHADEICQAADAVAFGRADFCAATLLRDPESHLVYHAMGEIAMAAQAAGKPVYDSPCTCLEAGHMEREVEIARSYGYAGKICIHPDQLVACLAFAPTPAERMAARELARLAGHGGIRRGGDFLAEPHYRLAQRMVTA